MNDAMLGFDEALGLSLVTAAVGTLWSRDLFQATVMFVLFGMIMAIAWCRLEAVDVAMAEAAIGAGLTGALLLSTLAAVGQHRCAARAADGDRPQDSGLHKWLVGAVALAATAALAAVVVPLATTTEFTAATAIPRSGSGEATTTNLAAALEDTLPRSGVDNPVTAVLLNFRAYDTLLEVAVLLAAVFSVLPISRLAKSRGNTPPLGPVLTTFIRWMVPLAILVATYVLWIGTKAPGGAFQAAAVLAAVAVVLILAGARLPSSSHRRWRLLLTFGPLVFLVAAVEGMFFERRFLEYRQDWAGITIIGIEVALTCSIALVLTMLFSATLPTDSYPARGQSADRGGSPDRRRRSASD